MCDDELVKKRGNFISRANYVLSKYKTMASEVKCRMLDTYCCHYYGSETWDFNNSHFNNILTSWNIAIRKAWDLPYRAHCYLLPVLANHYARDMIYSKFLTLHKSMSSSKNETVKFISKMCQYDSRSLLNRNIEKISRDWKMDHDIILKGAITKHDNVDYSNDQINNIASIVELNHCLNGLSNIDGFTRDELLYMYEYIAIS